MTVGRGHWTSPLVPPELTEEQRAQLAAVRDIEPDTVDIPPAPAASWEHARRCYRVRKEPISIRLDADVLDWLKRRSDRYQVEINRILRDAMEGNKAGEGDLPAETMRGY